MLPDTNISSQSYTIACIASFCIGAALYALVHKYCSSAQPTIILKQSPLEEKTIQEKFFNPLQTTADRIETNQKEIIKLLIEQKQSTEELHTHYIGLQKRIDGITEKTRIINEKKAELLKEVNTFCPTNNAIIPLFLTLYWANQYKKQSLEKQSQAPTDTKNILRISNEEST